MLLIPAPAKINLCLSVRRRRADGFHDIDSIAVIIDWHDLVGIALRPATRTVVRLRMGAHGNSDIPTGEENLAVRAARAVAAVAGPIDARLWLDKGLPAAAGLGGGSSDAAAVLRGGAWLAATGAFGEGSLDVLDEATLAQLAASLGSDVPMLLRGQAQRVWGRGEKLDPVTAGQLHLVIAVAGQSSTAATFAAVQGPDLEDGARSGAVAAALEAGMMPADDLLGSGLERAACRVNPALGERLSELRAALPEVRWHLTGSGGAAFALVETRRTACRLAAAALQAGFPARACRTVSG